MDVSHILNLGILPINWLTKKIIETFILNINFTLFCSIKLCLLNVSDGLTTQHWAFLPEIINPAATSFCSICKVDIII